MKAVLRPLPQVDVAIQEHMRLRNTITALRGYKEDLVILNPKNKPGQSSEAEPLSKWLEEDPAEAFLTFDQELGAHPEETKSGISMPRKIQSTPSGGSLLTAHGSRCLSCKLASCCPCLKISYILLPEDDFTFLKWTSRLPLIFLWAVCYAFL